MRRRDRCRRRREVGVRRRQGEGARGRWSWRTLTAGVDAAAMGVAVEWPIDATCPIVVIHAPVTPETHHMIGAAELALMQDDGFLVNTARSWVVDQDALLAELQSGRLRAALDVYDQEPLPADHPYRSLENVILTPHVAGASANELAAGLRGRGPRPIRREPLLTR